MAHFVISRDSDPPCWVNFKDWVNRDPVDIEHPFLGRYSEIVLDPLAYDEDLEQFGAKIEVVDLASAAGDEYWTERRYHVTFETDAHYTAFLLKFGPSTENLSIEYESRRILLDDMHDFINTKKFIDEGLVERKEDEKCLNIESTVL